MSSSQPSSPRSLQEVVANQKKQVQNKVREKFARFGDETCHRVMQHAMRPQGLSKLLFQLGLSSSSSARFEQQLGILSRFLNEYGPSLFLHCLDEGVQAPANYDDTQTRAKNAERMAKEAPLEAASEVASAGASIGASEGAADPVADSASDPAPEPPTGITEAKTAPVEVSTPPQAPAEPESEQTEPEEAKPVVEVETTTDPKYFDAGGEYIGPERRCGTERRSGRDRRNTVEAIGRNKRYGKDRRQQIRREDDREHKTRRDLGMPTH